MPVITPANLQPDYDVVIVGSGAGGGQMAYTLTMAGAKVLMLEAGRIYNPTSEVAMFHTPHQAPLRAVATPDKQYGFYDGSLASGWEIPGEPYTNAAEEDARQFRWWRQRMLGGRTNHWGRIALRNGPYDFKPYTRDGVGFDWPIGYEDIAPYYDKAEMLIGVFGAHDGLENTPDSSPGVLLPPPQFRAGELYARKHATKLGINVVSIHRAVLTTRQDAGTIPAKLHPGNAKAQRILADNMRIRAACFWATDCHRGCSIRAAYDSGAVHVAPALATGNLDLLPHAMAREVTIDANGRANGVVFIDKSTRVEHRVTGRAVVLAAGSQESVRLLLNSKSSRFPDGVANSSGKVGKYITDSVSSSYHGQIPAFENLPAHNEDGAGGPHAYVPWWMYKEQQAGQLDFPGGYHFEFATGRRMPGMSAATGFDWLSDREGLAFGADLKADARRYYGSTQGFSAQGAMVPNDDCYSELDPTVKDQWGIPVLRFHWKWGDYELKQIAHQQQTMASLLSVMGARFQRPPESDPLKAARKGGAVIHEVGGAIMGADPATSVTDRWSRTWDVPNLVMADGAPFANTANKNPTLTIMALAWRAADHLLDELQKGNV
jgi:choline dehydrogenase-like flavoprotein